MEKETKTYRFESEVIKHANSNPLISSFAEWACDRYKKEFMDIESLSLKMQSFFDMANECKDQLKKLKKAQIRESDLGVLKIHELNWVKNEAPKRVKNATFEGVYKYFVNHFDRKDINRRQLRLFIEKFS